jgi:hypothetical protein
VSSSLTFDCTPSAEEFRVYILWPSCQNGFMYLLLRTVMHANIETFVTFLWTFIFSTQKKNTKNNASIDFHQIVNCPLPVTLVTWTYISITVVEEKNKFTKIMLPILKYPANLGFRELFLRHKGVSFLTILWKSRT